MKEFINEKCGLYLGDCIEKAKSLPDNSVDLIIYSPPFHDMYTYSSDERDLSNCASYEEFINHYRFVIQETYRLLKPGRIVAIHCRDIPLTGNGGILEFPDDIIKLHKENGFIYWDKKTIWKDPLLTAIRTRQRALIHAQLVKDSTKCRGVLPDYILVLKKEGENKVPVEHNFGLTEYYGDFELMNNIDKEEYQMLKTNYIQHENDKTNRLSHFIWKRYADCMWEDISSNNFIEYKPSKEQEDERHLTPTSLDAIARLVIMYSNAGEIVFDPFGGCGSVPFQAVKLGRKAIATELKESYFNQMCKNMARLDEEDANADQLKLW